MVAELSSIRLVIVDDHPFVREGLRSYLASRAGIKVVGEAANGPAALNLVRRLRPDLVLMDVNMPGMSGLQVTELLRSEMPQVRILVLTVHTQLEYVLQVIRSGAHGFVAKDAAPAALHRAILKVARGGTHFTRESALAFLEDRVLAPNRKARAQPDSLARREREVLALLADGLTNKQIALRLTLSARTVETHRERLKRKLGLRSVAELTRFALLHGICAPRPPRGAPPP